MRYGVTLQAVAPPREFVTLVRWIEELGYDDLWVSDSSLHAGDVYVYMTLALEATVRLRVGTAVTNPLTRHPAITANVFQSLDVLAPGRVVCGTGVGERPLHALGLERARLETLGASITAMRRLWAGERVTGPVGRWSLRDASLTSAPGEIPVFVSASGPRTIEFTAEYADGVILVIDLTEKALDSALASIRRGRARSVRASFENNCFLYGAVDDDEAAALARARSIVAWLANVAPDSAGRAGIPAATVQAIRRSYRGREFQEAVEAAALVTDDIVREHAFAGTPAQAAAKLERLREHPFDAFSIAPLGPDPRPTIAAFARIAGVSDRSSG